MSWRREVEAASEGKSQPGSERWGGRLAPSRDDGGKDTGKRGHYASEVTTALRKETKWEKELPLGG